MADGGWQLLVHGRLIVGLEAHALSLRDALSAGHVVTRCRCGHRESADVSGWRCSSDDAGLSLGTLSRRIRCLCGSKEVALEVWPLAPIADRRRTYLWRR